MNIVKVENLRMAYPYRTSVKIEYFVVEKVSNRFDTVIVSRPFGVVGGRMIELKENMHVEVSGNGKAIMMELTDGKIKNEDDCFELMDIGRYEFYPLKDWSNEEQHEAEEETEEEDDLPW
ncbi:MAG: hypothetical protein ACRCX8_01545 [Sarcina sp.]